MKFIIENEHREFFQKNMAIEFEGLLSDEELTLLNHEISEVLSQRQDKGHNVYAARDLWRESSVIKKIACQRRFAEIAAQLVDEKPLRLGYDLFFPSPSLEAEPQPSKTLNEMSSLQGIVCGLLLCLSGKEPVTSSMEVQMFSGTSGNGVFLSPEAPINFQELSHHEGHSYYLVVYTKAKSVYIRNDQDPHTHAFKEVGYAFGDRLLDELNPIIYR